MNSSQMANLSISDLLATLGYAQFNIIAYSAFIPSAGLAGVILCALSAWIFFRPVFRQTEYVYYRIIALFHVLHLILAVPFGVCYSPLYVPPIYMQTCVSLKMVYIPFSNLSFHYTAVLEIAILLERMKNFSQLIKKHFTTQPLLISGLLFVACFIVDFFFLFVYAPATSYTFYFYDSRGVKQQGTFYTIGVSKLAMSQYGKVGVFLVYVVRDFFTLVVGVTLNLVSLVKCRRFMLNRRVNILFLAQYSIVHSQRVEKNLLFMVVTLCVVSIVSRITLIACNLCLLFNVMSYIGHILSSLINMVLVVGPCVSFFIFYNFNKVFRGEIRTIFKRILLSPATLRSRFS